MISEVSQRSSATQCLILCKHNLCKYGGISICMYMGGCLDGIVFVTFGVFAVSPPSLIVLLNDFLLL